MTTPNQSLTILDLIRFQIAKNPDKRIFTFLQDGEVEQAHLTYLEVDLQARAIAGYLQTVALPGDRAILRYPHGLDFITATMGCLYAGIVPIPCAPLPVGQPPETLLSIAADAGPKLLLTTAEMRPQLEIATIPFPALRSLILLATDTLTQTAAPEDWRPTPMEPEAVACLLYTSGSTKAARGITIRHGDIMRTLSRAGQTLQAETDIRIVSWMPHYHTTGMGEGIFYPLLGGIPMILMSPTAFLEQPVRWLRAITNYQATQSGGPNFAYELCVERVSPAECQTLNLSSWRLASLGTGPVYASTLARFAEAFSPYGFRREAFSVVYGLTEARTAISMAVNPTTCTVQRSALERDRVVPVSSGEADSATFVSCGRINPDSEARIVNPQTRRVCEADQVGEIWVSSTFAYSGYWNKPVETDETFHAYLADTDEGPFFRTGDIGFIKEGELYITGRFKDMIIVHGRNFYSEDIEQVVAQAHPVLMPGAAAAFSIPVGDSEQLVIVHEIKAAVQAVDVEEVAKAARGAIAKEMQLPVEAVVLVKPNSLPRTPSGKIQRYLVREQFLANHNQEG